ncbi:hypothetical protein ACFQY7_42905 [Actinomadura luteofluorescens]|uniref:hypothetical protein n=1 Tax=Actinomadura luteofluorescens TaxID=46163 RepID=UPI003628814E
MRCVQRSVGSGRTSTEVAPRRRASWSTRTTWADVVSTSWCQVPPTQPYGPNIMKWLGSPGMLMPS